MRYSVPYLRIPWPNFVILGLLTLYRLYDSKAEPISKLTVNLQLSQNYFSSAKKLYFANYEVRAECPKLGHTTLRFWLVNWQLPPVVVVDLRGSGYLYANTIDILNI